MRALIKILSLVLLVSAGYVLVAQKKKDAKPVKLQSRPSVDVFLGNSEYKGGNISRKEFNSLFRQGITARDSAGNMYKVNSFTFTYAERNLYEDSVGNLVILTDYIFEFCPGDTASAGVDVAIFKNDRVKAGDTAFFDGIKVMLPDGGITHGKAMKYIITK